VGMSIDGGKVDGIAMGEGEGNGSVIVARDLGKKRCVMRYELQKVWSRPVSHWAVCCCSILAERRVSRSQFFFCFCFTTSFFCETWTPTKAC
jgi:hypothetical protein